MFKKKLVALSAIMIAGLMTFQANVSADAVEEKPYLSLGADLSASQKSKVLELLGVKENELDQYKVVKVKMCIRDRCMTGQQELPAGQAGTLRL